MPLGLKSYGSRFFISRNNVRRPKGKAIREFKELQEVAAWGCQELENLRIRSCWLEWMRVTGSIAVDKSTDKMQFEDVKKQRSPAEG